jgi:hypothetical protein
MKIEASKVSSLLVSGEWQQIKQGSLHVSPGEQDAVLVFEEYEVALPRLASWSPHKGITRFALLDEVKGFEIYD